jgi:hypothetical protein
MDDKPTSEPASESGQQNQPPVAEICWTEDDG